MAEAQAETQLPTTLACGSHSLTDAELWGRRFDVIVRRSAGDSVNKISKFYAVTPWTIYKDIEAYYKAARLWADIERHQLTIINHCDFVIGTMNQDMIEARSRGEYELLPRLMGEINKAIERKSVVYGLVRPEVNNFSSVINVIQPNNWGKLRERQPAQLTSEPINQVDTQSQTPVPCPTS